jgi:tricorn protease
MKPVPRLALCLAVLLGRGVVLPAEVLAETFPTCVPTSVLATESASEPASVLATTPAPHALADTRGYYHSPALHGGTLVFASEGDLWAVPATGGTARRLTSHPSGESQPHISRDGRWLAFTGRYGGSPDVYVMPLEGGPVRRLTYESGIVEVQGWTPDGHVLYATNGAWARPGHGT